MKKLLICLDKRDFFDTPLYKSVFKEVFSNNKFCFKDYTSFSKDLDNPKYLEKNFNECEPEIEKIYLDLVKREIKSLIVSFYVDRDNSPRFGIVTYSFSKSKYELGKYDKSFDKVDTFRSDLSDETSLKICNFIKNLNFNEILRLDLYKAVQIEDDYYLVNENKLSEDVKVIIKTILFEKFNLSDIKLESVLIDIESIEKPLFSVVSFYSGTELFEYWFGYDDLPTHSRQVGGENKSSYLDVILSLASDAFIKKYEYLIIELKEKEARENVFNFISNFNVGLSFIESKKNIYFFKELGEEDFVIFNKEQFEIKTSRGSENIEYVSFSYNDLENNKQLIIDLINKYIDSETNELVQFKIDSEKYINNNFDLDTTIKEGSRLINISDTFPIYDLNRKEIIDLIIKIKDKYNLYLKADKEKINYTLKLLNKIVDEETYDKYSPDLFDVIEELNETEYLCIKDLYEEFLEVFGDLSKTNSERTIYRRVFIKPKVLDDLERIDSEQKIKLKEVMNEVVDKLKTLPGKELGKYLLRKGLNFPIKADRSIKKIRIINNAKYRVLFIYGSDFMDAEDRLHNLDSIYIFGITEHKKDKAELYRLAESKPAKYEINGFILYSKQHKHRIPECTPEQYKIANAIEDRPTVTFGCAGSGKTTVSIEKYVNIVYSKFSSVSPSSNELVYITFHKRLAEKVKKDLGEFKIDANCYKLDEYFAYVVGEKYDPNKTINEALFIKWFQKNYSPSEIEKNKDNKRTRISPLIDKPDIARLLYTYYRGVFKGSKKLFKLKKDYLTLNLFLEEMDEEKKLSDKEKEAIYNLCVEFHDYAIKNKLMDDNDYAIKVINHPKYRIKRTNCIIIDEVQDLTEIEIIATILTLNDDSNSIYFYGDPHQSINPNIFFHSTINEVFTALEKEATLENAPLNITYRTNANLIKYLNQLLDYRDEWLALTKGALTRIVEPPVVDENSSWAGYVTNRNLYKKIFATNPNSMIITPSDAVREELLKKYPETDAARVITIYDAKGMEWETVILYNMFTHYETYFKDMVNGNAKKSTIHRMTFNKYYVACTRSTKSFVILEENDDLFDSKNPIFETMLSQFAPIFDYSQINTYILEDNTFEAWYKEAVQNLDNDNEATFQHALAHARHLANGDPDKMKLIRDLLEGGPETLARHGFEYLKQGEYYLARSSFIKCNKQTKKHNKYVLLATVLGGMKLRDEDLNRFLANKELMDEYPESYVRLAKQPAFKRRIQKIRERLFGKEED